MNSETKHEIALDDAIRCAVEAGNIDLAERLRSVSFDLANRTGVKVEPGEVNCTPTKQQSEHTPGPWIVDDRHIHSINGRLAYPLGVEPETDVIVLVDTDCHSGGLLNDTDKANLALIAAAPELLEALKAIERYASTSMPLTKGYPIFTEARAAIAKATCG